MRLCVIAAVFFKYFLSFSFVLLIQAMTRTKTVTNVDSRRINGGKFGDLHQGRVGYIRELGSRVALANVPRNRYKDILPCMSTNQLFVLYTMSMRHRMLILFAM